METVEFIGVGRALYRFGLRRAIWRQQLADVQRQVPGCSMLKILAFCGTMLGLGALLFASELRAADDEIIAPTRIENVQVRDGVNIAVAVYLPKGTGRYPTLFAASPYRFDNNLLPPTPQFLWRETGPVKWYLDHGYAFVHM